MFEGACTAPSFSVDPMQTLMSVVGIVTLLCIAWLLSTNRSAINKRTVLTAFAVQAGIAGLILFVPQGSGLLDVVVGGVQHVIDYGNDGKEAIRLFLQRGYETGVLPRLIQPEFVSGD